MPMDVGRERGSQASELCVYPLGLSESWGTSLGPWCHHAQLGAYPSCWKENPARPLMSPGCGEEASAGHIWRRFSEHDHSRGQTQELGHSCGTDCRASASDIGCAVHCIVYPSPGPFTHPHSLPPNPLPTIRAPLRALSFFF